MSSIIQRIRESISIPEYFEKFVDINIKLLEEPKICCPFHEDSNPSFTYSPDKKLWRCWSGPCGGGDVIAAHKINYHLKTKDAAIESLCELLGLKNVEIDFNEKPPEVDKILVRLISLTSIADNLCKSKDDYLNLDFIMSQRKPVHERILDLESFLELKNYTAR